MSEFYDVLIQYGDDLIPLRVNKNGTFRDLKAKYAELFDVPIGRQVWGGRIGDLGIDDDFPLGGLGLENCEPLEVFSSEGNEPAARPPAFEAPIDIDEDIESGAMYSQDGQVSPRTAQAIAASLRSPEKVQIPIGVRAPPKPRTPVTATEISDSDDDDLDSLGASTGDAPIVIEDDDFEILEPQSRPIPSTTRGGMGMGMGMDDEYGGASRGSGPSPVRTQPIPSGSPWSSTRELMDRMSSMMGAGLGMNSDLFGGSGYGGGYGSDQPDAGFRPDGSFTKMYLVGPQKMNFLALLEQCCVLPHNWRLAFPSRAMMDASPFHSANSNFEAIVADAKDTSSFIVVHLLDGHADSSDFYNMIVSKEEVQGAYAEGFITYYANVGPVERSAFSKILTPSVARPFPIHLPLILILATLGGKLWVLDIADSKSNWGQYMDKLIITKETYSPQMLEDAILASERKNQTTIVDEQNSAFEMAQKADMERARQEEEQRARQAEESRLAALEEASRRQHEADQAMTAANAKSDLRSKYIENLKALAPEPTTGRPTIIAIRLPDGSQARRKFDPDVATLADVFTFIAGSMAEKLTEETFTDPSDPNRPWSIDNFDLSAQFPARRFTHAQDSETLRKVGLQGQELLNLVDRT